MCEAAPLRRVLVPHAVSPTKIRRSYSPRILEMGQLGSPNSSRGLASIYANLHPSHFHVFDRQVGAYGEVEYETGELRIDGNIYDSDFQVELDRLGLRLRMADHPPEESGVEEDFIIASKGAKRVDLQAGPEACVS